MTQGGSFLDGFLKGAIEGAISGALFGAIGSLGNLFGSTCGLFDKLTKVMPTVAKVSGSISLGMVGFYILSLITSLFDPNSLLVQWNKKLHESKLYNGFQFVVSAVAVFSGAYTKGMKNRVCFVAGTMILTATGLKLFKLVTK